ncbi:MAG: hypothetical protein Q9167_000100 [Letrouitia subvulpina]
MTTDEHTILNHYNIATPYPTAWPAEKDESDASDDEKLSKNVTKLNLRRSKSRYSALERSGSDRRSHIPGTEKTGDGVENLVQKDEADPLGGPESVVRALRQKGLPVEDDQRLSEIIRRKIVHANASTQSLLQGLEFLSRSIDQKSASLKVLVESNFERFVRAKTTIDNVYAEMRNQGADAPPPESSRTHSRIPSRSSVNFRNNSARGPLSPRGVNKPLPSDKKKHALTKDSEYGVQGIKAPLIDVAAKVEEIWGPALGGRDREENLKTAMSFIETNQGVFEVGKSITECISQRNYDNLAKEYFRARSYVNDVQDLAKKCVNNRTPVTGTNIYQMVATGRMWADVQDQITDFKRDIWKKLTDSHGKSTGPEGRRPAEGHMALINILLELGVEDNPIWFWLLSKYDYLKNKITSNFERSRVEIEILRRRLANMEAPSVHVSSANLNYSAKQLSQAEDLAQDTASVTELWEVIYNSIKNLLSVQGGILGEVLDFWAKAQSFTEEKTQKILPAGIDGQSRKHHRLSSDGVRDLQNGLIELVELLREDIFAFFADPPIEDISLLYSPIPPTTPSTPHSAVFSSFAHQDHRFKFDATNPPPPSPKRGEAWEEFAFWPPYANSLSGVHYLSRLLTLVTVSVTELAGMRPVASSPTTVEGLKMLIAGARERSLRAVCAAWGKDAEICKALEDWTRSKDRRDLTRMPFYFNAFENAVLAGLQKILYIQDSGASKPVPAGIISPPPSKLLQMVRTQFVTSLYKVLSGMVENAEKSSSKDNQPQESGRNGNTDNLPRVDKQSIRLLLTLSNLKAIQTNIVPSLISQFESNFSVQLTDESKTIRDVLSQIDARLFQSYTKPIVEKLSSIIYTGITSPAWVSPKDRPTEVRPYINETLLLLVSVHTEVSTTAPALLPPILTHLLEQISTAFLAAFKARTQKYPLAALMQATLDVEFVAQTMSQFTTEKASELQSQVYLELDKGTDNGARARLQSELPEMRATLKKLREGTKAEFGCFKKQRPKA